MSSAHFASIYSSSDSTAEELDFGWSFFALCCFHKDKSEGVIPAPEWEKQLIFMERQLSEAEQQAADDMSTRTDQTLLQTSLRSGLKPAPFVMAPVEDDALLTGTVSKSEASAEKPRRLLCNVPALVTAKVEEDALSTVSASASVVPPISEPDQEPEAECSARSPAGTFLATPQKLVRHARSRRFSQADGKTTNANVQLSQQWLGA